MQHPRLRVAIGDYGVGVRWQGSVPRRSCRHSSCADTILQGQRCAVEMTRSGKHGKPLQVDRVSFLRIRSQSEKLTVVFIQPTSCEPSSRTRITARRRGPRTPLMRVISMSAVALGPEMKVANTGAR